MYYLGTQGSLMGHFAYRGYPVYMYYMGTGESFMYYSGTGGGGGSSVHDMGFRGC